MRLLVIKHAAATTAASKAMSDQHFRLEQKQRLGYDARAPPARPDGDRPTIRPKEKQ
jgi:hypothetical protein